MSHQMEKKAIEQVVASKRIGTVMAELYASEINCSVASFWDGGWQVCLGDEQNGMVAIQGCFQDLEGAATWLHQEACKAYPESKYALESEGHPT